MDDPLRLVGRDDQLQQRTSAVWADHEILEFLVDFQQDIAQLAALRVKHVLVRDVVLAGAVRDLNT
jgi:hypothetical protein